MTITNVYKVERHSNEPRDHVFADVLMTHATTACQLNFDDKI